MEKLKIGGKESVAEITVDSFSKPDAVSSFGKLTILPSQSKTSAGGKSVFRSPLRFSMTGCTLRTPRTALPKSCIGVGSITSGQACGKEDGEALLLIGDKASCEGIYQNQPPGSSPVPTKQKCTFKIEKSGQNQKDKSVLRVYEDKIPHIAQNIEDAQKTGHPAELTRIEGRSRIRRQRREALRGKKAPSPDMSLDEYPFASTEVRWQRGAGSPGAS